MINVTSVVIKLQDSLKLIGLTPFQAVVVFGMLFSGLFVQWQFQHARHIHEDSDHED